MNGKSGLQQSKTRREQKIHGLRVLFYALIFLGLAWFTWHGIWAWVLFGVIVIEIGVTAWDFVVEDKTRVFRPMERMTHLVLSMVGGAYVALLIPVLTEWLRLPSIFIRAEYGLWSWILTFLGIVEFAWGIRDLWSGLALARNHSPALSPRAD
jgi:hypothetical protein